MSAIAKIERCSAETLKLIGVGAFLAFLPALLIPDGEITARVIGLAAVISNFGLVLFAPDFRWREVSPNPFRNGAVARTAYALAFLFLV